LYEVAGNESLADKATTLILSNKLRNILFAKKFPAMNCEKRILKEKFPVQQLKWE
jgi:hypothetical protein